MHNGALENLEDHQAGPPIGTIRSVGSVSQPAKVRRVPFTAEDDRILYALVDSCTEAGATSGNKIYMKLGTEVRITYLHLDVVAHILCRILDIHGNRGDLDGLNI